MLDLIATRISVITCVATPEAIEQVMSAADGALPCRVAPDEAMLVAAPDDGGSVARSVELASGAVDPDAVVVDATDGWTVWTLEGDPASAAFEHLSAVELPDEGFAQGDVARVPVRIVAGPRRIHLFVPSMWGEYLRGRIVSRCASMGVNEIVGPRSWDLGETRT